MGLKFNPFTGKLDYVGAGGGGGSPTGPAGGDLSGTYPNPTVDGLQGRPVSNATPYNGQVLQYDGTNWVPGSIPSGGSGGGGVVYYLNFNTAADAPLINIPQTPNATKELGIIADTVATSYLSPILSTASYDFLASFVTDLNVPSATAIPAGIWDFNTFAESTTTNSANQIYFKIEILKYDGVNAPTLLATSNDTYIYDPTEITQYVTSVVMPQTTILATDRIVVYLYGRAHQNNNTLTFHFGGQYPSHTHSTMPSVTGTGVVKVVNGVFQSPASTIVNTDVSATAAIDVSKLAMSTNRVLGRTTAGTGAVEELTPVGITVSGGNITGIGGTLGTVDNVVPRANGTGEYTIQNSGIIIEDTVVSFAVTGVAFTDIITATGSSFADGQPVRFTALTGGAGLNTTTNYFVRQASGSSFKVATTNSDATIVNFSSDITAGTLVDGHFTQTFVAVSENTTETNSALVLTPKGTGALIAGPKPDGTATGGNARGANAVDLQTSRSAATQVASGANSVVCGGVNNTAAALRSFIGSGQNNNIPAGTTDRCVIVGGSSNSFSGSNPSTSIIGCGNNNNVSGYYSGILTGDGNSIVGGFESIIVGGVGNQTNAQRASVVCGLRNSVTANYAAVLNGVVGIADRYNMQAHSAGAFTNTAVPRGEAQRARFVLFCKTTTNAAVEMALDGGTTYLGIPSGKVIACTINISGVKSDGSAVAHYVRQYAVKNVGGTSSEVYAPVTIGTDNAAGTVIALSANNADDTLRIAVTGIAAETWRWVASVDAVEIAYGT
jgi:hypothetical protein